MLPVPVERNDGGYHSSGRKGSFASATAIRKALAENDLDFLTEVVPEAFFSCLKLESCPQVTADDFSMILNEKLLTLPLCELTGISGMPEDLARKLHKNRLSFASFSGTDCFLQGPAVYVRPGEPLSFKYGAGDHPGGNGAL